MNSDQQFQLIERIAAEPKRNAKIKLLDDELRAVFFFALNPFLHYQIRSLPPTWRGEGGRLLTEHDWSLLLKLHHRNITGKRGRNAVRDVLRAVSPNSSTLFRRVVLKDMRCGVGIGSANVRWPKMIPVFEVMKAERWKDHYYRLHFPYWISPKLDGIRAIYKDGNFFFRSGRLIQGLPHLQRELADLNITLDGELMVPGMDNYTASGKLRSHSPVLGARYEVFDAPSIEGPLRRRLEVVTVSLAGKRFCTPVAHVLVDNMRELDDWYLNAIKLGFEGIMMKDTHHSYMDGRHAAWIKRKKADLYEVTVLGSYEGEGKYKGMLGGIIVKYVDGPPFNCGGGFSDEQREQLWWERDTLPDRVASVEAQEVTKNGKLREPRFKTWRLDL